MALLTSDIEGWLSKHPELNHRRDRILEEVRKEADAEGAVASGVVRQIMGDETSGQLFRELFERWSSR